MTKKRGRPERSVRAGTRKILLVSFLFCIFSLSILDARAAADLSPAKGPVLLTVAGKIQHTNRGPAVVPGDVEDTLFFRLDIDFARAAEFDIDMIEALGMGTHTIRYPGLNQTFVFEGPLLRDVLDAVGATGTTVKLVALDGYTVELPVETIGPDGPVLAAKRNGRHLGLGGFGPTWLVYTGAVSTDDDEDDTGWAWAVFFIAVE